MCSTMCILFSFVLCLLILSSFLARSVEIHIYHCSVQRTTIYLLESYSSFNSFCWTCVLHIVLCVSKAVYLLVSYFSFNTFCWTCVLHFIMYKQDSLFA